MHKYFSRATQVVIDLAVLSFAMTLAYLVRFDWVPPTNQIGTMFLTAPYVIIFQYVVLVIFGVPRFSWRYIGVPEAARIFLATGAATFGLVMGRVIAYAMQSRYPYIRHGVIPFGVLAIDAFLMFLGISGVRVARRMLAEEIESKARRNATTKERVRTMLIGAGQAGVLVAREISRSPELGIEAIGFIDDDPSKIGTLVYGVPVLGTSENLTKLCEEHDAQQLLITMASANSGAMRRINRLCEQSGLPTKIIPGVYEIVGGQVNLSRIRKVEIEDLLGREPVNLDLEAIAEIVKGRAVLVTGSGGSIGSELCRQLCSFEPGNLILVERSENALFNIHRELQRTFPTVHVIPCIADVGDVSRMEEIFATHRPTIVFHAAAHKHVPMMEWNPGEAVKNNFFGTKNVADLADEYGTQAFVLISTDKAVNPTSVMGATKRCAEIYVQALSKRSRTRFVAVRFGNVLGSAGSVIPIFQEQIARGGPVMVTHPEMRRFFMTIPEACQLVLQAASMGDGGEIFILDMGEPVRIVDLARDLISLSGLRENDDIEIKFSGVRPGEKLFEELSTDAEQAEKTRHSKIFIGRVRPQSWDEVVTYIDTLRECTTSTLEPKGVIAVLRKVVPEFSPPRVDGDGRTSNPNHQEPSDIAGPPLH